MEHLFRIAKGTHHFTLLLQIDPKFGHDEEQIEMNDRRAPTQSSVTRRVFYLSQALLHLFFLSFFFRSMFYSHSGRWLLMI